MVLVVIVLPIPPVGARGADAETPTTAMRGDIATSHPSAWRGAGGGGMERTLSPINDIASKVPSEDEEGGGGGGGGGGRRLPPAPEGG